MASVLYYEFGENAFTAGMFFRLVQEYIETYMKNGPASTSSMPFSSSKRFHGHASYLTRGCFAMGVFYLSQNRAEEAKLFLL
jgi:hypothetical protein